MLVAGIDSSTQSCKVLIRDAATGALVRSGSAKHPDGTEVHPSVWWVALLEAIEKAGGLDDVAALSVGGQQHGMVVLDADGEVIRPALLWNDTRSAEGAEQLIAELGEARGNGADDGARVWAEQIGTVPVASITATKLRWLANAEPENAARVAAVALPHDWLTWMLAGGPAAGFEALATDRSDASGTGYFSPRLIFTISSRGTTMMRARPSGCPSEISCSSRRCHPSRSVHCTPREASSSSTASSCGASGDHHPDWLFTRWLTVSIASDFVWPMSPTGPRLIHPVANTPGMTSPLSPMTWPSRFGITPRRSSNGMPCSGEPK